MKKRKLETKKVIVIGAGPAGLAAGIKLSEHKKKVLIFEKEKQVGGLSKTIKSKGFYFDLGGHRFFTKSKEVNKLWGETLNKDFLTRPRLSRIYYRGKFFDYPIKIKNALANLGFWTSLGVLFSYFASKISPYKKEETFKQWVSNRFGKKLFNIFFKTYTEKLWGIPCSEIQAEWAAQRIRGLSLLVALKSALLPNKVGGIKTLIDQFQYPKYGPGMMYGKMAENIKQMGGKLFTSEGVIEIKHRNLKITSIITQNQKRQEKEYSADYFLSSMPITDLVKYLSPSAPNTVLRAANALSYRSFITISIILDTKEPFPDTWIYIHSPEVKMGRIQNFKKWSPFMVKDKNKTALGLEYFCTENDDLWNMSDKDLIDLGLGELEKIGLGKRNHFVTGFVARAAKAYPVYNQNYPSNIKIIKDYLKKFSNLQPIGRYGMFKYNNMDHSILTGFYAAENILGAKHNVWEVNADEEYHEEAKR